MNTSWSQLTMTTPTLLQNACRLWNPTHLAPISVSALFRRVSPNVPTVSVSGYQPNPPAPGQMGISGLGWHAPWSPAKASQPPKRHRPRGPPVSFDAPMPKPPVLRPPPLQQSGPTLDPTGFPSLVPPWPPRLADNPPTRVLQEQIDDALSRGVGRRLPHLGQPPMLTPRLAYRYGPSPAFIARPSIQIPASSTRNPLAGQAQVI